MPSSSASGKRWDISGSGSNRESPGCRCRALWHLGARSQPLFESFRESPLRASGQLQEATAAMAAPAQPKKIVAPTVSQINAEFVTQVSPGVPTCVRRDAEALKPGGGVDFNVLITCKLQVKHWKSYSGRGRSALDHKTCF